MSVYQAKNGKWYCIFYTEELDKNGITQKDLKVLVGKEVESLQPEEPVRSSGELRRRLPAGRGR